MPHGCTCVRLQKRSNANLQYSMFSCCVSILQREKCNQNRSYRNENVSGKFPKYQTTCTGSNKCINKRHLSFHIRDSFKVTLLLAVLSYLHYILKTGNIYQLTHEAEPFLRSRQLCGYSRTFHYFMEPEGSLPPSQERSTATYPEPHQSNPYHPILSL
jgi:hypothetical protein